MIIFRTESDFGSKEKLVVDDTEQLLDGFVVVW